MTNKKECENCKYEQNPIIKEPCKGCLGYYSKWKKWEPRDKKEAVNHPNHYNRGGSMECIDEMVEVFGAEAVKQFCLLNVWKYRYRAAGKNGEEDLKKSDWYMRKYAELNKGDNI